MAASEILILDTTITDTRSSVPPNRRKWSQGTLVRYLVDELGNEWFDLLNDHHQSTTKLHDGRGDAIFAKVKAAARPIVPADELTPKVRIQRLAFRMAECGLFNCAPLLLALVDSGALRELELDVALRSLEESTDDEASVYRTVMLAFNPNHGK